jgi:nucleotide-binding universal stress UspA family protein
MRHVPEARDQIDRELDSLLEPAQGTSLHVRLIIREGDPAREILHAAGTVRADLIVLGAQAPHLKRRSRRSVPDTIVGRATCPVLVVPFQGAASLPSFTGYRHVVGAMDFSEHARAALLYAVSIAQYAGAALTLMHVVETEEALLVPNECGSEDTQSAAQVQRVHHRLRALAEDCKGGSAINRVVRTGVASREIARLIPEIGGDLVVIGVRGTRIGDPRRAGSTTTQLVERATCDVLTVGCRESSTA